MEFTIGIASTSSIGGLWFFKNWLGGYIWATIGAASIICTAVIKPRLRLTEKIRKEQELLAGYKILDHDLHCICIDVRHKKHYGDDDYKELQKALKRKAEIVKKSDSLISKKVQHFYQDEVDEEFPLDSFFIPED